MNQVLSREEVAALLQGLAQSKPDPMESRPAKKRRRLAGPEQAAVQPMPRRWYQVNSPR